MEVGLCVLRGLNSRLPWKEFLWCPILAWISLKMTHLIHSTVWCSSVCIIALPSYTMYWVHSLLWTEGYCKCKPHSAAGGFMGQQHQLTKTWGAEERHYCFNWFKFPNQWNYCDIWSNILYKLQISIESKRRHDNILSLEPYGKFYIFFFIPSIYLSFHSSTYPSIYFLQVFSV